MDEPGTHTNPAGSDPAGELQALENIQRRLWANLRQEDDPEVRMTLLSRFSENRAAIEDLRRRLGIEDGDRAYQVRIVDSSDDRPTPARQTPAPDTNPDHGALPPPAFISPPPAIGAGSGRGRLEEAAGNGSHPGPGPDWGEEEPRLAPPRVANDPYQTPLQQGRRRPPSDDPTIYETPAPDPSLPSPAALPPAAAAPAGPMGYDLPGPADHYADQYTDHYQAPRGAHDHVAPPPSMGVPHAASVAHGGNGGDVDDFGMFAGTAGDQVRASIRQVPPRAYWLAGGAVVALVAVWLLTLVFGGGTPDADVAGEVVAGPEVDQSTTDIGAALRAAGFEGIMVDDSGDIVLVSGIVASESDRAAVLGAVRALAGGRDVDGTNLAVASGQTAATGPAPTGGETISRPAAMQTELNRVVAATPIIFGSSRADLTELHKRILNSVASIMLAYPDIPVKVVGFTDADGADEGNQALSLQRAAEVKAYLVSQGVPDTSLAVEAMGESTSSGSAAIASLERRVEFEVVGASAAGPAGGDRPLKIAVVAPSARNDLAFTQSMVDAVELIAGERGNVEVAITDSTFVPEEAAAAIRGYAEQDFDLVIAHGSQFGAPLIEIAEDHPDVAFAWGTASDTFGLPNVYAYDASAGEGGYVLGAVAAALSQSGVVGVVGPIEVGDAQKYVNGFAAGAQAERPGLSVPITYTGSFSDLTLAAEAAQAHVNGGADVMTGSAQMVVGAVSIASENNALWFGTQSNQSELAPSLVVASQVYHWEVILREIIADIDGGAVSGRFYTANLANGGIVIEYNEGYPLPDTVRQRADQLVAGIINGSVVVPG